MVTGGAACGVRGGMVGGRNDPPPGRGQFFLPQDQQCQDEPGEHAAQVSGFPARVVPLENNDGAGDAEDGQGELAHAQIDRREQKLHPGARKKHRARGHDAVNGAGGPHHGNEAPFRIKEPHVPQQGGKQGRRHAAEKIIQQEAQMAEAFLHDRPEKPQGDHVEHDVPQIGVQELVGKQPPQFPFMKACVFTVGPVKLDQVQTARRVNIPWNIHLEEKPEDKDDHIEQDQPVHHHGAALVKQMLPYRISPVLVLRSHIRPHVIVFRAF